MDLRTPEPEESRFISTTTTPVNPPLLIRAQASETHSSPTQPGTSHGIRWREGTVDNEFLGRKKSNCCCIYKKPRRWDESSSSSSSSSSDEGSGGGTGKPGINKHVHCTEHCRGHTKRCYKNKATENQEANSPSAQSTDPPSYESVVHPEQPSEGSGPTT
ncbi:hypothetical protein CRM22_002405 [Opisthorchis felineus]|uniref:E3 ubiquitin-protein ligase PPP1R11 n=1 Tax=Opisthorchis felineus TaxID=147828 RepID=A0A4S2M665_OPIFE|nr:hypothetical protein CRM22_002405 [Opisthorchis felineus]